MTTATLERTQEQPVRRWDPFEAFEELQEELGRFAGTPFGLFPRRPLRRLFKTSARYPRVDMYEKNDSLFIKVDLPGLKKEDIKVSLDDGELVVQGESKKESEVKEEDYYFLERAAGSFYRRLTLPFEIRAEKIEANFKDGVLEIHVPKPAVKKPEPQKVSVR